MVSVKTALRHGPGLSSKYKKPLHCTIVNYLHLVSFYNPAPFPALMAKTDSFFVRKTLNVDHDNVYREDEIDIGAFVDALGNTVMRILNVAVVWSDNSGRSTLIQDEESAASQFQLCTQHQDDIVLASDKSIICSGRVVVGALNKYVAGGVHLPGNVDEAFDLNPQTWSNGYLVGVETLYLGGSASVEWAGNQYVTVVLECQSESLTKSKAMALALSQQ
jgi:hypothetical protein